MQPRRWAAVFGTIACLGAGIAHAQARGTPQTAKSEATGAADELRESGDAMGLVHEHYVRNTATFDVTGAALGDGLNGQYVRSLKRKLSSVLGANYSRTDAVGGSLTKFGAEVGLDYFLIGQHNEGLRVGPRVVAEVGVNTTGGSAGFGDVGAGAELGYNFISKQGITAGAAAGWDLVFKGQLGGNSTGDVDGHPYGKLNVGYSW